MRVVVVGGGFGGLGATRHLERALRRHTGAEITLVSRENFFVITPLLFEACSGRLELRHCAQPIRAALRRARFVEATVEQVDVERQIVRAVAAEGTNYDLPYGFARAYACRCARIWRAADRVSRLVDTADVLLIPDATLGPTAAYRARLDSGCVLSAGHHEDWPARRAGAGTATSGNGRPRSSIEADMSTNDDEARRRRLNVASSVLIGVLIPQMNA